MLVHLIVYGILVFALTKMLNATAFKQTPASGMVAWTLTIALFILSVVALSALKMLSYDTISDEVGVRIVPKNPLDVGVAFAVSWMFFSLLNRREKRNRLALEVKSKTLTATETVRAEKYPASESVPVKSSVPAAAFPDSSLARSVEVSRPVVSNATAPANSAMQALNQTIQPATAGHHVVQPSAPSDDFDESLWARALAEFDGAERRPGLWAKSFAGAGGSESFAKAAYLSARVAQLQLLRLEAERLEASRLAQEAKAKLNADKLAQDAAREREIALEASTRFAATGWKARAVGCTNCNHYRREVPFMQNAIHFCKSIKSELPIRPGKNGEGGVMIIDSLKRASNCLGFTMLSCNNAEDRLVSCSSCNSAIPEIATMCPRCGCDFTPPSPWKKLPL